ncbi:hypothetical protein FISHEDRAFT_37392 [Fistulina hepatica ATCC 64428]|uniref:Mitochondrial import inner membrane translocase subunit n=1 Tax=Fistulina hepatica ATCC 64428 TaxID=1128425 RepID=A0A0D7AKT4_9AGAR|nr:hypothetical protein FISHEDRAFT_37392 [Fistulina hepatica ATCC 64428]
MSFLGGRAPVPNGGINHDKVEGALLEMDSIRDFFTKMILSCHNKCISQRYTEGDLNKGESVCVDRCVKKYTEVQRIVNEKMMPQGQMGGGAIGH